MKLKQILTVVTVLVLLSSAAVAALSSGSVTRSFSASTVLPNGEIMVTLTPSPSSIFDLPGYRVIETVPEGFTVTANTAVNAANAGNVWTFINIGSSAITYNVTAPAAATVGTFSGTFKDEDGNEGTVSGNSSVTVSSPDLEVSIQTRDEVIINSDETIRIVVRNLGTIASETTTLTATIDGAPLLTNTPVPSIGPGDNMVFLATWNAANAGEHTVSASIVHKNSDTNAGNDIDTKLIMVKDYNINVWYMSYPYSPVYDGNTFWISANVDASYAGTANASITFDRPGLNAIMPDTSFTLYNSSYNYISWEIKADELGKYNATITVSGFDKINTISTTQGKTSQVQGVYNTTYIPYGPINVIAQTVIVKDLNWTSVVDQPRTLGYQVFNVTEIDEPGAYYWELSKPARSLKIDLSAGAEGRLLMGLEYLFGYPHGCPEQTMSPTLGAKRVEQYYLNRGKLTPELNATLYDKVKTGVNRMSPDGNDNPQQIPGVGTGTGGWAWGTGTPSMFYTVYTHYGMGVILSNTNYSHLVYNANINVNESARWIIDNQNSDGSWTGSGYISGDVPMTGFTMVALEQTLPYMNTTMRTRTLGALSSATAYLLQKQKSNGGWEPSYYYTADTDAYSTSLALRGLMDSGNNSAAVQLSTANGIGWLIGNQNGDGSWNKYSGSQSWSYYGDLAETTAYSVLALNESGIPSETNETIRNGLRYLVGVYQDQGSWGSTKSSQTAIYALTGLQVPEDIDTTVSIVLKDVINKEIRLNNSNPSATISSLPKPYLVTDRLWIQLDRSQLNAIGIGTNVINITNIGTGKVLVSVESKQNAVKREALARVPAAYIDPIADNFTLALGLPEQIKDGDTIIMNATITNRDTANGLYVMVMEVPFSSNVTFPNTYPANTAYYIRNGSKVMVQNLYNASLNKLYIYPGSDDESRPSVLAGGSSSFYFNATMSGFGQRTIEAKAMPMYNDTLMAIANITTTVKGYGNVTVKTLDINDNITTANVLVGTSAIGETARELEGSYSLSVTKAGYLPVTTTINVIPGSNKVHTAKLVSRAVDPVAVFYETDTTALPANVSGTATKVYSFTVQSNGGKTIIALQTPVNHTFLSAAINGVNASSRNESGIIYVEAELTGDSRYELRFQAAQVSITQRYDANGNGRIDRSEAITAVVDFFSGLISRQDAISIVVAFFAGA